MFIVSMVARIKHKTHKFYKLIVSMLLNIIVWLLCVLIIQVSSNEATILFVHEFKYIAILSLPILMMFYSYAVKTGRELENKTKFLLSMTPVPLFILIMTNDYHHYFRESLSIIVTDDLTLVHTVNSFLFYITVFYVYSMVFLSLLNFISAFKRQPLQFRDREIQLILAMIIPLIFNLIYQVGNIVFALDFDPTPIGFFICICIFYYHFFIKKSDTSKLFARGFMVDYMNDGLLYLNHHQNISDANKSFIELSDIDLEDIYDKPLTAIEGELFRILSELLVGPANVTEYKTTLGVDEYYYRITYQHMYTIDKKYIGTLFTFTNITDLKLTLINLEYISTHDTLTNLNNRFYFENQLKHYNKYEYFPLGLIICDINLLKYINDTKGHHAGDNLLVNTANILSELVPTKATTCRIGSNEFAILVPNTTGSEIDTLKNTIIQLCCYTHGNIPQKHISIGSAIKLDQEMSLSEFMTMINENTI